MFTHNQLPHNYYTPCQFTVVPQYSFILPIILLDYWLVSSTSGEIEPVCYVELRKMAMTIVVFIPQLVQFDQKQFAIGQN